MKLMTFDAGNGARVGLVNEAGIVDLTKHAGVTSLRGLIADGKVDAMAAHAGAAADHALDDVTFLPVIPDPDHIWCVGVNYMDHLQEAIDAGLPRSKSEHPMIFGRYADTMVGHKQNLMKSPLVHKLDYECELAVIIGKPGRHIAKEDALSHVAGYSCFNEGSARDWQYHTAQVVPGKNFAKTGGFRSVDGHRRRNPRSPGARHLDRPQRRDHAKRQHEGHDLRCCDLHLLCLEHARTAAG